MPQITVSLYLDRRRKKKNGKYPLKLTVYDSFSGRQKQFGLKLDLDEGEYVQAYSAQRTKAAYKELKYKLSSIETSAAKVANGFEPFTFEEFEKKFFNKRHQGSNVVYHFQTMIDEKSKRGGSHRTIQGYESSVKSFDKFTKEKFKKPFSTFLFQDISIAFLELYESFMISEKGLKQNTVGVYLRDLRTAFNRAIESKDVDAELFPFGRHKYQIPSQRGKKKALGKLKLKLLFNANPKTYQQEKARDLWLFSYVCNGMNINDIVRLKRSDLDSKNETIIFFRGKTKNTSKGNSKPITVYLNDFSKDFIQKYGASDSSFYLFNFISTGLDEAEISRTVKNLTRFVNQHIKNLAKDIGVTDKLSFNWARHSYATNLVRLGGSMEMAQDSLGHQTIRMTHTYFAGFDQEEKREFSQKIMDIMK